MGQIKNAIERHEIISFDIYDTLLVRPYVQPSDLFRHLELKEASPGFCRSRVDAERASRKLNFETTYDDIYHSIKEEFKRLKDVELDYELSLTRANSEMLEAFQFALAKGKRVVLLSDMYLPSGFLKELLLKNGYLGYEMLFVSCEHKCNKHSGGLFKVALDYLGADPKSILHIGDNRRSDFKVPTSMGMDAICYDSMMTQYFNANPREGRCYRRSKSLDMSILIAMDSLHWKGSLSKEGGNGYWYEASYRFGGPIIYSYLRFLEHNLDEGDNQIYFIARDGYNLMHICRLLSKSPRKCVYLYAPRVFRYLKGPEMGINREYTSWIVRSFQFNDEVRKLTDGLKLSSKVCNDLYHRNSELFERIRIGEMEKYERYIKNSIATEGSVFIVDVTTLKFSSQRLVKAFLDSNQEVMGCYHTVLSKRFDGRYVNFHDRGGKLINWSKVNVSEFFMSSPEPPICGLNDDFTPIFKTGYSDHESFRISLQDDILKGETDYVQDMMDAFGDKLPDISSEPMRQWMDVLIKRRSHLDKKNLLNMRWAPDFDHNEYHYLIFNWKDIRYHVTVKLFGMARNMISRIW